ncbi:hypothetical protein BSKO_08399 [Bryopsis sp. KO-2023]|nr:hypothetical protein BSKO_08399 [Bryopsis sp. KO-2023]
MTGFTLGAYVLAVLVLQEANAHALPHTDRKLSPDWNSPLKRISRPGSLLRSYEMDNYVYCSNRYCAYVVNMCHKGVAAMVRSKIGEGAEMANHVMTVSPGSMVKVMDSDSPEFYLKAYSYQDTAKDHWPTFEMSGRKIYMPFEYRRSKEYNLLFWRFELHNGYPSEVELNCSHY